MHWTMMLITVEALVPVEALVLVVVLAAEADFPQVALGSDQAVRSAQAKRSPQEAQPLDLDPRLDLVQTRDRLLAVHLRTLPDSTPTSRPSLVSASSDALIPISRKITR